MALTITSSLPNAVVVKYERDFLLAAAQQPVWGKFVKWEPVSEGNGGSSFSFGAYQDVSPALTPLSEDSDVVPVALGDTALTVTPQEYGNAIGLSKKLRFQARTNVKTDAGDIMGRNQALSVDRLIRNGIMSGSTVRYPSGVGARTGLDASSDKVSQNFLLLLHAHALSLGLEPWEGDTFVCPIHPLLEVDLLQLTQVLGYQYYRPNEILKGLPGFTFAGFRFIPHRWGKLYMSGGTPAQAATTLASTAAAGATSVVVSDATGLAVGDYITLGTLEAADAEQVLIITVAGTTLTIQGRGNSPTNTGLRFPHEAGAAVTEAANVAAIPVIGKNSILGVYGDETGQYGRPTLAQNLDLLGRFIYPGWYWYGGVGVWNRYLIRAEVAVSGGWIGSEE